MSLDPMPRLRTVQVSSDGKELWVHHYVDAYVQRNVSDNLRDEGTAHVSFEKLEDGRWVILGGHHASLTRDFMTSGKFPIIIKD